MLETAYEMRISDWSSDCCSSDRDTFVRWRHHCGTRAFPADCPARSPPPDMIMSKDFMSVNKQDLPYRRCAGVMLVNYEGKIFVGQRLDTRAEARSEEHTSELQSLMRISYALFCLKHKTTNNKTN